MSTFSRLGKNTALIMVGNASSKLIALLMLPLYTSWLSVDDYGTTDIITVYSTLLLGIVSGCIAEAIFVIPKNQSEIEKVKYFSSGLYYLIGAFFSSAILLFVLFVVLIEFNKNNSFTDNIVGIYFVLISNIMFVYAQQFCRSIDKIANYSIAGIIVTLSTAVFSLIFIPPYGVNGFIFATVASYFVATLYIIVSSRLFHYVDCCGFDKDKLKELLSYSIPLIPNSIMWWLVSASNRPVLEMTCGLGAIGILAVAGKFPGMLNVLLNAFNSSWVISVLEEYGKGGFDVFYNKGIKWFCFILFTAAFGITIFGKWIIAFFTSDISYHDSWIFMPMLAFSTVLSCLAGLIGSVYSAVKKSKYYFYTSIWSALSAVFFNIILIPIWGLWGAVFANTLSMLVMLLSRTYYSMKYVKITAVKNIFVNSLFFILIFVQTILNQSLMGFIVNIFVLLVYFIVNRSYLHKLNMLVVNILSKTIRA